MRDQAQKNEKKDSGGKTDYGKPLQAVFIGYMIDDQCRKEENNNEKKDQARIGKILTEGTINKKRKNEIEYA